MRNGSSWVSSSHIVSSSPSFSRRQLLTFLPCSSRASLLTELPQHNRTSMSFSNCVLPLGFFMNCFSVGPFHNVQSFRNRLIQCGFPMNSQMLPENLLQLGVSFSVETQEPAPEPVSHHDKASFKQIHLLQCGILHGLGSDSLPHHCLHQRLQKNLSSCSWSTCSFCSDLGICRVVHLTYSSYSLPVVVVQDVFLLFKYFIPEVLPRSLIGSALANAGSVLDPSGIFSVRHKGNFWQLLTEVTPVAPSSTTKTLPCKHNPSILSPLSMEKYMKTHFSKIHHACFVRICHHFSISYFQKGSRLIEQKNVPVLSPELLLPSINSHSLGKILIFVAKLIVDL